MSNKKHFLQITWFGGGGEKGFIKILSLFYQLTLSEGFQDAICLQNFHIFNNKKRCIINYRNYLVLNIVGLPIKMSTNK